MTLQDFARVADWTLPLLFWVSLKSCALILCAGFVARLLEKRQAAARHLVWSLAIAGLALLPALEFAAPGWALPAPWGALAVPVAAGSPNLSAVEPLIWEYDVVPRPVTDADDSIQDLGNSRVSRLEFAPAQQQVVLDFADFEQEIQDAGKARVPPVGSLWSSFSPTALVLSLWITGVVCLWVRTLGGLGSLCVTKSRSLPARDGLISSIAGVVAGELGVNRKVDVRLGVLTALPATWGWLRPTVLLPESAVYWPAERIHSVLKHEFAHVQRCDWLTLIVAQATVAFHWFNPLAWCVLRQLLKEQELACDDRVVTCGTRAADYAAELVAVLRESVAGRRFSPVALGISRVHDLENRLLALLDVRRDHRSMSRRVGVAISVAAAVILVCLGSLRIVPAETVGVDPVAGERPAEELDNTISARETARDSYPLQVAQAVGDGVRGDQEQAAVAPAGQSLKVEQVRELVRKLYSGKYDPQTLDEGAVQGMLAALNDPHTRLVPPLETAAMSGVGTAGCISGIGAMFKRESRRMQVVAPLPGSAAARAGLKPGDVVEKIDGQSVAELGFESAIRSIAGPAGSTVVLEVDRAGSSVELSIVRTQIQNPSVRGITYGAEPGWNFWLDEARRIAYVRLGAFESTTSADLRQALSSVKESQGLVLDLRNSPGGLLPTAVEIAQMLIPEGTLWTLRGATKEQSITFTADRSRLAIGPVPLIVLIDETTASAAEILAGALQESGRGVVLGMRSHGKGSVQSLVPLEGSGQMLRLTTGLIELPSGRTLDRTFNPDRYGVDPDDGFWLISSAVERGVREQKRRELDADSTALSAKLAMGASPEQVAEWFVDHPLGAALAAMRLRLEKGEYVAVGGKADAVLIAQKKRSDLERERADLQQKLHQIDQELSGLN